MVRWRFEQGGWADVEEDGWEQGEAQEILGVTEVTDQGIHSIAKGAVEAARQFICEALPCDFRVPIVRDEGFFTPRLHA